MKNKVIILGVPGIYLLLTAAAIYYLVEILQLNFTMALLTVTSVFWSIAGIVIFLLRDKLYSGLVKLSKDKKERLLNNYMRQLKLYWFMLWSSPIYALTIIAVYKYVPDVQLDFINIAIIAVSFYLGAILSILKIKYVSMKLKNI